MVVRDLLHQLEFLLHQLELRVRRVVVVSCLATSLWSLAKVAGVGAQSVTPDGSSVTAAPNASGDLVWFTVEEQYGQAQTFTLWCTPDGTVVTACETESSVWIEPYGSIQMWVSFSTGASPGTGNVWLYATGDSGGDAGYYDVTVVSNMTTSGEANNNEHQDAGVCAASCFAATYAQSTVPYYSLDTPRNVTLVYHGDRSSVRPFVYADVNPSPGAPVASEYRLQAKVDGAFVTFLTGEQTLRFSGSSQQVRLGGQFDASSYGTGVRSLQIIATALYSGGGSEQDVIDTKLLVVDERRSHIARGWSIAGIRRKDQEWMQGPNGHWRYR